MTPDPVEVIERALVQIRRDQQSRHLHRPSSPGTFADAARFRYLDTLEPTEGLAISEVAEAIGVDRPRASRLTAELVDGGYVQRAPDPEDSRYARVRLTAKGRHLVEEVRRSRRDAVRTALAALGPEEASTLAALLERFLAAWPR